VLQVWEHKLAEGDYQNSCFGVQVPAWHGSALPMGILPAAVICRQPPALIRTLWFHEPGRITATSVSQYRDLGHGTVFLLTFEPQTFQSKHSDTN